MADTTDFKNGLVLKIDNKLMQIVEFQHVKPGKGPAFVRTKLKDVVTGKTVDKTWNAGVKVETATVDRRDMTYLYNDGTSYVVMDEKTFEQYELPPEKFGDAARFLLENMRVQVSFHEGEALFAELPISVDLKIEQTEPGKGGEIQITDALMKQAKDGCVLAYKFKGQRFDCGSAEGYIEATNFCYENFYLTGKAF